MGNEEFLQQELDKIRDWAVDNKMKIDLIRTRQYVFEGYKLK